MRRFHLERDVDETGISGTGRVAEGVEFTDGRVVLRWLSDVASTVTYDALADVDKIHGHGGKTSIVFVDPTEPTRRQLDDLRAALGLDSRTVDLADPRSFLDDAISRAAALSHAVRSLA